MRKANFIFILIIVLFSCSRVKQKPQYEISGTIEPGSDIKEILLVTQTQEIQDTCILENNRFIFQGSISEPTNAAIQIDGKMLQFPLVNDKINITINNLEKSKFNVLYNQSLIKKNIDEYFEAESKSYVNEYKILNSELVEANDDETKYMIMLQQDSISKAFLNEIIEKFKAQEDKSGLSIIVNDLKGLIGTKNHPQKIEELYTMLSLNEQQGFFGKKIETYIEQSAKIALGEQVDFNFIDINNNPGKISDYEGKLVLLEFWASWCGPCVSQIPVLKKIAKKNDKIFIVSISIDENIELWKQKVEDLEMFWTNIHCKQQNIDLKKDFFITSIPFNILLSQEGEIIRKNITMEQLLKLLE